MQQRQTGVQSGQMGSGFGGYMQQMQKQVGGLQNQIQAMSQKQQVNTPSAAGNKFLNKTGYKPNNDYVHNKENHLATLTEKLKKAQGAAYEDTIASIDGTKHTITADQMKEYKINQAQGSLAMSQKHFELKEKYGDNKAAANKEFEEWRAKHYSQSSINKQLGLHHTSLFQDTYTADPVASPPNVGGYASGFKTSNPKLDNFLGGIPSGGLTVGGLSYSNKDAFRKAVLAGSVNAKLW